MGGWTAAVPRKTPILQQDEVIQKAQARVVQHHYVRAQLKDINVTGREGLIQETLKALKTAPGMQKAKDKQLMAAYEKITQRLQAAELTINFKASSWFTQPNHYETYAQMYERG